MNVVVGLTQLDDQPVYVNPAKVTMLTRGNGDSANTATVVSFEPGLAVTVKGDIDYIAFQLFPDGVR